MDAAELVIVDYDPLPAVTDPRGVEEASAPVPGGRHERLLADVPGERDESLFDDCEVVVSGASSASASRPAARAALVPQQWSARTAA